MTLFERCSNYLAFWESDCFIIEHQYFLPTIWHAINCDCKSVLDPCKTVIDAQWYLASTLNYLPIKLIMSLNNI